MVATGKTDPTDQGLYRDIVETNLFGVWNTLVASVPSMIRKGRGGSIILTSSTQGLVGRGGDGSAAAFAYAASKHGVVGLMRVAATSYAEHSIRVNTVHPTGVFTPMVVNEHMAQVFTEHPSASKLATNLLPVPFVEAQDVTNAVVWLASDHGYLTDGQFVFFRFPGVPILAVLFSFSQVPLMMKDLSAQEEAEVVPPPPPAD